MLSQRLPFHSSVYSMRTTPCEQLSETCIQSRPSYGFSLYTTVGLCGFPL